MKSIKNMSKKGAVLLFTGVALLWSTSALAVNLAAIEAYWIAPDQSVTVNSDRVRMWSFIPDPGSCPPSTDVWKPIELEGAVGGNLNIQLRNCLAEPISVVIPGQSTTMQPQFFTDGNGRQRMKSFTSEIAPNGVGIYTWNNLKEGTFLVHSGSHPAKQVHMGLYGSLVVGRNALAKADTLLLLSEIDPVLHENAEAATPTNYKPKYYLINGKTAWVNNAGIPFPSNRAGTVRQATQLRFVNAGLMTHIPSISGQYVKIFAEDGNYYPYPKEQYTVLLPAGKTIDALWTPADGRRYTLFDRRLSLTYEGSSGGGMTQFINVNPFPWPIFRPATQGGN